MKNNKQTLCFVAGKSGGHLIPALTYARQCKQAHQTTRILFFSTSGSLDKIIVHQSNLPLIHIPLAIESVPYNRFWRFPLFAFCLFTAIIKSIYHLHRHKPESVSSFGGLVSFPVCLAAYLLRIPIDLHPLDTTPGLAITWLAPLARTIYVCFVQVQKHLPTYRCIASPYPIKFSANDRTLPKTPIYQQLGFDQNKKTLLILGGSQGSQFINESALHIFADNPELQSVQVIHQTGAHPIEPIKSWYAKHNIRAHVFDFINNLGPYYRIADLAVCRSGAGTLFELIFFEIPTITIPLQTKSTDHQLYNACALAEMYPQLINYVEQKKLEQSPEFLRNFVVALISHQKKLPHREHIHET